MFKLHSCRYNKKKRLFDLIFFVWASRQGKKNRSSGLFFFIIRMYQKYILIINTRLFKGLSLRGPVTLKIFADRNCTDSSGLYTGNFRTRNFPLSSLLMQRGIGGCVFTNLSNHFPVVYKYNLKQLT